MYFKFHFPVFFYVPSPLPALSNCYSVLAALTRSGSDEILTNISLRFKLFIALRLETP